MRGRTQFRQNSHEGYQTSGESSGNGWKKKGKGRSRSKSRTKARKCYGCGNTGHFIKDCHKEKGKLKAKERDEVNVLASTSDISGGEVYMITSPAAYTAELNLTANSRIHEWILDSGASFHVTSEKNWFCKLHESKVGHVVLCDNFAYTIAGIGNINVKFDTGFVYTLKDVRYIPELSRNLISVGRLEKDDFTGKIGNGMLKMIKGALVSIKGIKKNDIYITIGEVIRDVNSSISSTKIDHTHMA
jgi:hypothetical protein